MDFILGCNFNIPRPVLPDGVAQCEGFGQLSWITKCITLTNESGVDVARGICHNVSAELVIDSNDLPLGNDRVAIQIAESLLEEEVPSELMFSMRAWHIPRVFLNSASLYDHGAFSGYGYSKNAVTKTQFHTFATSRLPCEL
jgi:hypothetical protein